jgi:MFS family permease
LFVSSLQQEFCLTDGELGWLFSGFFWSYALLQIPTGMILDRFGVMWVYRVSAVRSLRRRPLPPVA